MSDSESNDRAPKIWLDLFEFASTSPHVWADHAWRCRRAAMILWHLSHGNAELILHDGIEIVTPRGSSNVELLSVFMLLAGVAIEDLTKGIYIRRKKTDVSTGKFPDVLTHHNVFNLLNQLAVSLTAKEEALVKRLQTFVSWAGKYAVPKDVKDTIPIRHADGRFGPPKSFEPDDGTAFEILFRRLEELLLLPR
jgi:hypothetical protein